MESNKRLKKYNKNFPFFYRTILSRIYSLIYRSKIKKIKTFVIFLGYPRSGHSIIGALLDSHPKITISHEVNALKLLKNGVTRNLLFGKILSKASYFYKNGSKWSGYSYRVKNQFQNNFNSLEIIGDKKGGGTTHLVSDDINNLKLLEKLNCRIKIIHITRNPFDNIVSRAQGGNANNRDITRKRIERAIKKHINTIETIEKVKSLKKYEMIDIKMEDFAENPSKILRNLLNFIDVCYNENYINKCSEIVNKSSRKKRNLITWQKIDIDIINDLINRVEFLKGYSFESRK